MPVGPAGDCRRSGRSSRPGWPRRAGARRPGTGPRRDGRARSAGPIHRVPARQSPRAARAAAAAGGRPRRRSRWPGAASAPSRPSSVAAQDDRDGPDARSRSLHLMSQRPMRAQLRCVISGVVWLCISALGVFLALGQGATSFAAGDLGRLRGDARGVGGKLDTGHGMLELGCPANNVLGSPIGQRDLAIEAVDLAQPCRCRASGRPPHRSRRRALRDRPCARCASPRPAGAGRARWRLPRAWRVISAS